MSSPIFYAFRNFSGTDSSSRFSKISCMALRSSFSCAYRTSHCGGCSSQSAGFAAVTAERFYQMSSIGLAPQHGKETVPDGTVSLDHS